tara:strand:+ start:2002 stop:2562 length:561 start_codon:yes stop_codon:yes gene_type:complete
MDLRSHYPNATENTEYTNAIRDFLFWCRKNRVNPLPIAVDGIRKHGTWIESRQLSGWTLLEMIEAFPEEQRCREVISSHDSHVEKYVAIAGEGRENAVQFFCDLAEEIGLDELLLAMKQSDIAMRTKMGVMAVDQDEFYDFADLVQRFGDEYARRIMKDCDVATDSSVDGASVCEWLKDNIDESTD